MVHKAKAHKDLWKPKVLQNDYKLYYWLAFKVFSNINIINYNTNFFYVDDKILPDFLRSLQSISKLGYDGLHYIEHLFHRRFGMDRHICC